MYLHDLTRYIIVYCIIDIIINIQNYINILDSAVKNKKSYQAVQSHAFHRVGTENKHEI